MSNNYPKLHNAGWPGVVGKGPDAEEPFLLRPVDDLQGERRDAVVLSVGYGRTVDGRLDCEHQCDQGRQPGYGRRAVGLAVSCL